MPNELQTKTSFEIIVTDEQKTLVKQTVFPDATDAELALFFFDCTRRGIHPLDKLIHPTKRNGKYTPITSIDLFRQRASESGEHMGTDDATYTGEPSKPTFAASVTVYKHLRGEKCAFTATARWSEYFPGEKQGFMWQKMPHLMLAKCAEALALRKAFPQQLHGLYTQEEMAQAESPVIVNRPVVNIPQTRPQVGNRDMSPVVDDPYPKPVRQVDNGQQGLTAQSGPPVTPDKELDAPAPKTESAAEFALRMADKADDQFVDGFITNLQPYSGTKRNEKGKRPGQFDVDDGTENILLKWVKFFDPGLDLTSGLKRVYYKTTSYQGRTQYECLKIESLETAE